MTRGWIDREITLFRERERGTYEEHCTARSLDNEIRHVADQVRIETQVEEHIENGEDHLSCIRGVEIPVANGGHGSHRPVDGRYVAHPETSLLEVRNHRSYPRPSFIRIVIRQHVKDTPRTVYNQQSHRK